MAPVSGGSPFASLKRKPLHVLLSEEESGQLHRTLTLFDLTAIGIGGTVGSGVFTLVGSVAASDCGPSVLVSLAIGTFGCLLTCNAYIKLSRAIPSTGSVYAYTYHCLGEVFAVIAASCLTLEYALSGSAVATSWGGKLADEANMPWLKALKIPGVNVTVNLGAAVVCVPCIAILLVGLNAGKQFTNVVTCVKCLVVAFMVVVSLSQFRSANLQPLIPPRDVQKARYGVEGVFKGAVDCFFAFIGFDEVCCLAGEAVNPKRDLPWSVALSVAGTAVLTFLAALGLVGMQYYTTMDPQSPGFAAAFRAQGLDWAAHISAAGEIVTLPVVVFISFLPQARLFYAMSMDGLLPLAFTRLTRQGVLFWSNAWIGVICTALGMVIDFSVFNDMISAGVLLSFILANCSLIMLSLKPRPAAAAEGAREGEAQPDGCSPPSEPRPPSTLQGLEPSRDSLNILAPPADQPEDTAMFSYIGRVLAVFCLSAVTVMTLVSGLTMPSTFAGQLHGAPSEVRLVALVCTALCGCVMLLCYAILSSRQHDKELGSVLVPALAIIFNSFMLSTLSVQGFMIITAYFMVSLMIYFTYGLRHSSGRHSHGRWERASLVEANGGEENPARVLPAH